MNIHYPFFPRPVPYLESNIDKEIIKLRQEISLIKEKINQLEQEKKTNYLKKDDSLYML